MHIRHMRHGSCVAGSCFTLRELRSKALVVPNECGFEFGANITFIGNDVSIRKSCASAKGRPDFIAKPRNKQTHCTSDYEANCPCNIMGGKKEKNRAEK